MAHVVMNIWPFIFALTFNSRVSAPDTPIGKLAASISQTALSWYAMILLVVCVLFGVSASFSPPKQTSAEDKAAHQ